VVRCRIMCRRHTISCTVADPYFFWVFTDPDHQAEIVSKTFIPTVSLILYDFLSLKNDVNVPSKSAVLNVTDQNSRS
jgi:hypothetical protein